MLQLTTLLNQASIPLPTACAAAVSSLTLSTKAPQCIYNSSSIPKKNVPAQHPTLQASAVVLALSCVSLNIATSVIKSCI